MKAAVPLIAAALTLSLIPHLSHANPDSLGELKAAEAYLKAKDYKKAIAKTQPLLDSLTLDTVEEIILAHRTLGVSHCELGDQPKAREHFEALVAFSPTETIDDVVVTKPCQTFYWRIQKEKAPPGVRIPAPQAATPAQPPPPSASLETQKAAALGEPTASASSPAPDDPFRPKTIDPYQDTWKRYVPFGTGQFANGQDGKGWAFLSTEAVATATAISFFTLFQVEKSDSGTFTNTKRASAYRAIYWSSLGIGLGAAVWGIVDAVVVQKRMQKERTNSNRLKNLSPKTGLVWTF